MALVVLLLAALLQPLLATPAAAWGFPNQQIADRARAYAIGSWQGQCKVFAGKVVNEVLAANGISARVGGYGSPGGAYYGAYQNAGGVLVGVNDAQPGDLIQTINPAYKNSDDPPLRGLHTAIVVARTGTTGTYVVRDSNWHLDERVAEHQWSPASYAAARDAAAYVWRFGSVAPVSAAPIGNLDGVSSPEAGAVHVRGWAYDPDVPATNLEIHAYLGGPAGSGARGINLGRTATARPDVQRAHPSAGPTTGFEARIDDAAVGSYDVYVYAIDGNGDRHVLLGAQRVDVMEPSPIGALDEVASPEPGKVRLRGWAFDASVPGQSLELHAYFGGPAGSGAPGRSVGRTGTPRPDVQAAHTAAGPNAGFDLLLDAAPGSYPVHVYAIDQGIGDNREIGHRAVTVAEPIVTEVVVLGSAGAVPDAVAARLGEIAGTTPHRLSGANRYATAAAVVADAFPNPVDTVYVGTGANYPDALAGSAAAATLDAPMLLVPPSGVPDEVAAQLRRLQPKTVKVLGSAGAVPEAVVTQIRQITGVTPARLAGPDRYSTAAAVVADAFPATAGTVYVGTGANYPDALAGSAAAAAFDAPMLLVPPTGVPEAVAAQLRRLAPGTVKVLGSAGAVPDAVVAQLARITGVTPTRLAGADRYATAAAVIADAFGSRARVVYVGTGANYPDALAGSAAAAALDAPVLLVPPTGVPAAIERQLARLSGR